MDEFKEGDIVECVRPVLPPGGRWVAIVGAPRGSPHRVPLIGWRYDNDTVWRLDRNGGTDECKLITDKQRCEEIYADYVRAVLTGDVISD